MKNEMKTEKNDIELFSNWKRRRVDEKSFVVYLFAPTAAGFVAGCSKFAVDPNPENAVKFDEKTAVQTAAKIGKNAFVMSVFE